MSLSSSSVLMGVPRSFTIVGAAEIRTSITTAIIAASTTPPRMSFWTRVHLARSALAWSKSLLKKSFMSPPARAHSPAFRGAARFPTRIIGPRVPFPKGTRPSVVGRLHAAAQHAPTCFASQRVLIISFHAVTTRDMTVLAKLSDIFASAMAMVTSCASTESGSATTL